MAIISPSINIVAHPNGNPSSYLSCVRATTSTAYTNATGNLMVASANTIRQNFDIGTGEFMGIMVEGSSTNVLRTMSKDIRVLSSANGYTLSNVTVTAVSGQGVKDKTSGTVNNTCSNVQTTNTSGVLTIPVNVTNGSKYSVSVYVRKQPTSSSDPQLQIITNGAAQNTWPHKVGTDTFTTISDSLNWTRIGITFTATSSTSSIGLRILNATKLYVDYLQVEQGNRTSPIYQSAPGGTRAADYLRLLPSIYTSGAIDPDEGTIYVQFYPGENVAKFSEQICGIFALGNMDSAGVLGTNPIQAYISMQSSGGATITTDAGNIVIASTDAGVPKWYKLAISYRTGSPDKATVNGQSIVSAEVGRSSIDTSATGGLTLGLLNLGAGASFYLDGYIKHFAYFPKYFSNDDLISLTS